MIEYFKTKSSVGDIMDEILCNVKMGAVKDNNEENIVEEDNIKEEDIGKCNNLRHNSSACVAT